MPTWGCGAAMGWKWGPAVAGCGSTEDKEVQVCPEVDWSCLRGGGGGARGSAFMRAPVMSMGRATWGAFGTLRLGGRAATMGACGDVGSGGEKDKGACNTATRSCWLTRLFQEACIRQGNAYSMSTQPPRGNAESMSTQLIVHMCGTMYMVWISDAWLLYES